MHRHETFRLGKLRCRLRTCMCTRVISIPNLKKNTNNLSTLFFSCAAQKPWQQNVLVFEGMGEFFLLFWSSVFDLLLRATINTVAMATPREEAQTHHVTEAYAAA